MSLIISCTCGAATRKGGDRFVAAGQRSQFGVVVGIGQIAYVEYEVRCDRDAVLESKRLERQRQIRVRRVDELPHPVTKQIRMQPARVDRMPDFSQRIKQRSLERDRLGHRAGAAALELAQRHRMTPARFGKPLHQRGVRRGQKQDANIVTRRRATSKSSSARRPTLLRCARRPIPRRRMCGRIQVSSTVPAENCGGRLSTQ